MLMPDIFGENLLDDFFGYPVYSQKEEVNNIMKTDIVETKEGYEFIMDLPGVKKENVTIEFEKGYLTVHVNAEKEEKEGRKYIHRERYTGGCSRKLFAGDQVRNEDIKAKFVDGTLRLFVAKPKEQEEKDRFISIEG